MNYIFLLLPFLFTSTDGLPNIGIERFSMENTAACRFFGTDYAEKIIREPVVTLDEAASEDGDGKSAKCSFGPRSGGTAPKVHFMLTESKDETTSKAIIRDIRLSNRDLDGFEKWPGVGDEALIHTDGKNFQMIVIRKGIRSLRLKINPLNGVPLDVTKAVAMALEKRL